MLSHKKDIYPLGFALMTTAAQIALYFSAPAMPLLLVILASCILFFLCAICLAIVHNTSHCPLFKNKHLNLIFDYMQFFQVLLVPLHQKIQHVFWHHNAYLDQSKEPQPWLRQGKVVNKYKFAYLILVELYPTVLRKAKSYPRYARPFYLHTVCCATMLSCAILYNPLGALFAILLPAVASLYTIAERSWAHHSDLSLTDPWSATRSDVSKFGNWISFNLGYHAAHHYKPAVHWSELPELHARIAHKIPEHLISK